MAESCVDELRQIILEELKSRNFAESTIRTHIHKVEQFSRSSFARSSFLPIRLNEVFAPHKRMGLRPSLDRYHWAT
jgi:hypothetical protein